MKKVFIVAGEASGDMHGAALARELKALSPDIQLSGYGGAEMREAGVNILYALADLAVIGFFEVIKNIVAIRKLLKKTERHLEENRPDALVLIDYPGFNFKVGQIARQLNIPVIYYITPQVWAWWPGRVKEMKRFVNKALVIFSFEEEIFKKEGIAVRWVGHPLVDKFTPLEKGADFDQRSSSLKADGGLELSSLQTVGEQTSLTGFTPAKTLDIYERFHLNRGKRLVGLLPGSRTQEIAHLLPLMLKVAENLSTRFPDVEFVLLRSPNIPEEEIKKYLQYSTAKVTIVADEAYQVRMALTFALVASGTATLETAYLGIPMVIMYKVNPLSYFLGKKFVRIPYIGLANIVLEKKVVAEFIQDATDPEAVTREVSQYVGDEKKINAMTAELIEVRKKLGPPGASARAAQEILTLISG